eukprot:symbB.v1.2.011559.t1/scaffold715.1/size233058/5
MNPYSQGDFDGEKLVLVDRSRGLGPPLFRIVHLERNQHTEVDNLPSADSMTLLKLWGASYLVCAQHRNLVVYDYEDQAVKLTINSNGSEIMAVDSQDPEILATLDRDATAKLWNGRTGECMAKVHIPDAHYHMGYPYCLCVSGHRIVLSADEGVFLAELDDETQRELPPWVEVEYRGKIEMKGKGQAYVGIRRVLEHAPHLAAILPQHMQEGVLSEKAPWYEDISKVWQCAGCKRSQKDDENPVDADITMVCKTWGRHQGWMNVYRPVGPHHTEV